MDDLIIWIYITDNILPIKHFDKREFCNFSAYYMPHWFLNLRKKVFICIILDKIVFIIFAIVAIKYEIFKFTANIFCQNYILLW